jgi:predicted phage replisome organizer
MAEDKRYYWLKLNDNFFEDDTISWIEEQESGKDYVLFYLKLCLKSLRTEGSLIRNVGERLIPYNVNALSRLTNTQIDTVKVAMKLFSDIGLVTIFDTGEIFLNQINEMIGTETDSAKRKRRQRSKEALLESSDNVTNKSDELPQISDDVTNSSDSFQKSPAEIEIEKEIEKEIDAEEEKVTNGSPDVHLFFQKNLGVEPPTIQQDIDYWIEDLSAPVVIEALKRAVEAEKTYSYAKGIMKKWAAKGIRTIEQVNQETTAWDRKNNGKQEEESVNEYESLGF